MEQHNIGRLIRAAAATALERPPRRKISSQLRRKPEPDTEYRLQQLTYLGQQVLIAVHFELPSRFALALCC